MTFEEYEDLRDRNGMTNADVARETGIDRSVFSQWKSGRSKPKQDKIDKINILFGISHQPDATIDIESLMLLKDIKLRKLLLAGGKIKEKHPEVIDAIIYTLERMQ